MKNFYKGQAAVIKGTVVEDVPGVGVRFRMEYSGRIILVPTEYVHPDSEGDNPASDPIGTVRDRNGEFWVRMFHRGTTGEYPWALVSDGGNGAPHKAMEGCPVVGAVPGTPAWERYGSGGR